MRLKKTALLGLALFVAGASVKAASVQIFDERADAHQLIAAAIAQASRTRKNIVLDFGANWCPDCHALDAQMHQGELASIIKRDFVVVPVNIGRYDRNLDIARQYGVPLKKGIPALAILDPRGKLLYAQSNGQFANARSMNPANFVAFFQKWEPKRG